MNKTIYIDDPALWEAVKREAKRDGESMSHLITRLLRVYLRVSQEPKKGAKA